MIHKNSLVDTLSEKSTNTENAEIPQAVEALHKRIKEIAGCDQEKLI